MNRPKLSVDSVMKGMKAATGRWVDGVLRQHLPKDIYFAAHSADPSERERGLRWCEQNGFRIIEEGEMVFVKKNSKVIAQTRRVLELEHPEDLISLGKVANIKQGGGK